MSRIHGRFEALAKAKRTALIPYITAGDPHPSLTVPLMRGLVEAGSDIIELGVPFSDPMADGPVIQRSGERALKQGVGLGDVLRMVGDFRTSDSATPVVLMGYANPIEAMGSGKFLQAAKILGIQQPSVSRLLNGRSGDYSLERLMDFLTDLGQDVEIAVGPTRKEHGQVSVVVA